MSGSRRLVALALLAGSASLGACGGGQTRGAAFDASWSNDDGAAIAAFQQKFASIEVPRAADVAVGVGKQSLVGVPLDGGSKWTFEHPLDGRPTVAGSVVVGMGAGELFALDAKTGRRLWVRRAGGLLRGAGDDGKTTVVSLMSTTGQGTTVLAVGHDGVVIRQIEDEAAIGVPAVVDTWAFLPWQGQYVTVYDLLQGKETARVLSRTQVSRAFTQGGAVFFGEAGVTRLDDKIRLAPRNQASTVTLPARELPGQPRWMKSGTDVLLVSSGAHDKIGLYARPTASGAPGIEGDRFAATYYKIAVGLDASKGGLAWAHAHDAEFLAGGAYAGGFALCDASGKVVFLDAKSGGVAGQVSMGRPIESCVVQVDALSKPAVTQAPAIAEQLAKVVTMPESEHVMIQKVLLREMATIEEPLVTKTLIDLASSPRTPPLLLEEARKALAGRRNGVDFMLAALGKRYDFLADVLRPPPVGPIADALAALKDKRGAPLLAAHLNDPADTLDDAQRAAAALVQLADKSELAALATFFAHYRGVAEDEMLVSAVVSSAQALVKLGGEATVAHAATDPFTSDKVRTRIAGLVKSKKGDDKATGAARPQALKGGDSGTEAGRAETQPAASPSAKQ